MSGGVLTTGVVIRRRATTEWMAPRPAAGQARGLVFVFFLEVAPVSEGVLTTGVVIRRRAATEWMARGGWFLFFFLKVAPVSEGDCFTRSGETGRGRRG